MGRRRLGVGLEGEAAVHPDAVAAAAGVARSEWRVWMRDLGGRQRRLREFLGLSQEQLARLAGVSQGAVSRLEAARGLATPMLVVLKVTGALAAELERRAPAPIAPELEEVIARQAALTPYALGFDDLPHAGDPGLEELVRLYRETPPRRRRALLSVLRVLARGFGGLG